MSAPEPFTFDPEGPSAIVHGENLALLESLPDESFSLVYLDPPFNTGRDQVRRTTRSVPVAAGEGDRVGFAGRSRRYAMLVDDGVVTVLHLEESPGTCEISGGEAMLGAL